MGQTEVQNLGQKTQGFFRPNVCDTSHTYFKTHPNFQHFVVNEPKCLIFVEKAQGLWKKAQAF